MRDHRRLQHLGPRREAALPAGRRDHRAAPDRLPRGRLVVCLAAVLFLGGTANAATPKLPPLPARWPHTLQIGASESPGNVWKPLGFRYQYLAGGVNTGNGWSTWNPNGSFVTRYENETWAAGQIPV